MKPKKLIIIGGEKGGGIATCVDHNRKHYNINEYEVMGFLNDSEQGEICGHPVIGKTKDCKKYFNEENIYFSYAIHIIGKNKIGDQLFHSLEIPRNKLATIVHGSAVVLDNAILEPGVSILAQTYISSVKLGYGVMVSPNSTVCHGTEVGPLSYISMGSVVGSLVKIGRSVSVSLGANIIEKSVLGDYSVVAAGAVVNCNIPKESIYAGVPAKFLRKIEA